MLIITKKFGKPLVYAVWGSQNLCKTIITGVLHQFFNKSSLAWPISAPISATFRLYSSLGTLKKGIEKVDTFLLQNAVLHDHLMVKLRHLHNI